MICWYCGRRSRIKIMISIGRLRIWQDKSCLALLPDKRRRSDLKKDIMAVLLTLMIQSCLKRFRWLWFRKKTDGGSWCLYTTHWTNCTYLLNSYNSRKRLSGLSRLQPCSWLSLQSVFCKKRRKKSCWWLEIFQITRRLRDHRATGGEDTITHVVMLSEYLLFYVSSG